jgi:hypothetical protein
MPFAMPSKSYEQMMDLIFGNLPPNSPFSPELIMAIAWEESLFNNRKQLGGTAWGFGQVEPAEFHKLEKPDAIYKVAGLPRRIKDGSKTNLLGELSDEQSIRVEIGILMHNLKHLGSPRAALHAYAGVGFSGADVPERLATSEDRIKLVNGWLACEAHLQRKWTPPPPPKTGVAPSPYVLPKHLPDYADDFPTFVKQGLAKAKNFDQKDKKIDDILFPKTSFTSDGKPCWLPNGQSNPAFFAIQQDMRTRGLL